MEPCNQEKLGIDSNDPHMESHDDWELVSACKNEKDHFFPILVRRHYALVVNIGYRFFSDRMHAEDMAQEVFLKLYHHIGQLRRGNQPFVHWLCRTTSNCCRSFYRKQSSEKRTIETEKVLFWYQDKEADAANRIDEETKQDIEYINDSLRRIKPNERIVLILSHIAELKTCDIAPMIKKPEYTVRRLLRRAEEKIRKLITQRILEKHARA